MVRRASGNFMPNNVKLFAKLYCYVEPGIKIEIYKKERQ